MTKKATMENLNSSLGDAVIKLRLQGKKQCIGMIQSWWFSICCCAALLFRRPYPESFNNNFLSEPGASLFWPSTLYTQARILCGGKHFCTANRLKSLVAIMRASAEGKTSSIGVIQHLFGQHGLSELCSTSAIGSTSGERYCWAHSLYIFST
jgi:hypothetical protein